MKHSYVLASPPAALCARQTTLRSIFTLTAILALFYFPGVALAQESCGNIVTNNFGETNTTPVEDCADPFDTTENPTEAPQFTSNGIQVVAGQALVASTTSFEVPITVAFSDPTIRQVFSSIYVHEGDDYRQVGTQQVTLSGVRQVTRSVTATGTYTLVVSAFRDGGIQVGSKPNGLLDSLFALLIPTAHAQPVPVNSGFENFAIIFTVEQVIPEPEPTGASSVLFLPGIQSSRLYKENVFGGEDQLWTPTNFFSQDVGQLEMTAAGQSVNSIYTRDILGEAPGVGSVYATFVSYMDQLQRDGVIHEFKPFAYDWRFGVDTVVNRGVRYEQGVLDLVKVLGVLAEDAPSGQVTIIGHSNGGLVAKALVQELLNQGKEDLVDQIIFIGTPHTGTPKAIGTILHGYDQSVNLLGLPVVQASVAREVINNMPGAYGLLPTLAYFRDLDEPVIQIANTTSTKPLFDTYGSDIGSYQEFSSFLIGESDSLDRRLDQSISVPTTVNRSLFEQSDSLDDWVAPETITVTQIVGMGLWTPASILYREVIEEECTIVPGSGQRVCGNNALLRPFAKLSRDGDETVMGRSAQAYAGDSEIYYVDMENVEQSDIFQVSHYNLTEAAEIQNLIQDILLATTSSYSYISSTKPDFDELYDIEVIDSPVLLSATDSNGNTSGVVRENDTVTIKTEIPGSQYFEFGGSKYLVLPSDLERTTTLVGEDFGGYTLTLATVGGDNVTEIQSVMSNASVTPTMRAAFSKTSAGYSTIVTDIDGDGTADVETTVLGEVVTVPDSASYDSLRSLVTSFQLSTSKQRVINRFISRAERFSQSDNRRKQRINRFYLRLIDRTLAWYQRAGLISRENRQSARVVIRELRKQS